MHVHPGRRALSLARLAHWGRYGPLLAAMGRYGPLGPLGPLGRARLSDPTYTQFPEGILRTPE